MNYKPQEEESGNNSCCHFDLSCIKIKKNKIQFPSYYLEDYFCDLFYDLDIKYKYIKMENGSSFIEVDKDDIDWDILYLAKIEAYSAVNWYDTLKDYTIKSILVPLKTNDLKTIVTTEKINYPSFVKLDTVSPKDEHLTCVFHNDEDLITTFESSSRIQNTLKNNKITLPYHYLFIREVNNDILYNNGSLLRCFIYHKKLTAISSDNTHSIVETIIIKTKIIEFINIFISILPYNDTVIEIFINKDYKCIIVELNGFGADSPTGAGQYNWKNDYFILHGLNNEVNFRGSK